MHNAATTRAQKRKKQKSGLHRVKVEDADDVDAIVLLVLNFDALVEASCETKLFEGMVVLVEDGVNVGGLASILWTVDEVSSCLGCDIDDGAFDGVVCLVGGGIKM